MADKDNAPTQAPALELNQLGSARIYGLTLAAIVIALTICGIIWVHKHREVRIVKAHQPLFLTTLFVGLLLWELAVIPLSIDDGNASQRGCDIACMSTAWLINMGATITFAALYSKLRRINKLFNNPQFRRVKVEAKDVMLPFAVLFTLNFTFMLCWNILDPLRWERQPIDDTNPWNTFGSCSDVGHLGEAFSACTNIVQIVALIMVCCQAWRARRISDEFSESKKIGVVLYNWLQLLIIVAPAQELIGDENPQATYSLKVSELLASCASMLFALFVPIFMHYRRFRLEGGRGGTVRITGISENVASHYTARTSNATSEGGHTVSRSSEDTNTVRAQLAAVQQANADLKQRVVDLEEENQQIKQLGQCENDENDKKQEAHSVDISTEIEATVSNGDNELENGRHSGNDLEAV